eukprot:3985313-Ditylum_brightwellii.AAC.1
MEIPEQEPGNIKVNYVFAIIEEIEGKIFSDQSEAFPRVSSRGMQYIMLFYIYDASCIKAFPTSEFQRVYKEMYKELTRKGFKQNLHKLDNETSKDLLTQIEQQSTKVQLTLPDMHRQNLNEKALQAWKNHFISELVGLLDKIPITHWCSLVEQSNMMLNLLRPCHQNQSLLAESAMNRYFNFNATPMAPLGIGVSVHMKPDRQSSWGYHALQVWYVGPAMQHYRCYKEIMKSSEAKCITDTIEFHHHKV